MIVPRDTVAAAIWGADWEQKYSDWAIDRIAHRVRSKLKKFGPFDTMLKTIKRKGFLFE
jgi:DNA-binding winged helix-turn-helix (wHTH) protein